MGVPDGSVTLTFLKENWFFQITLTRRSGGGARAYRAYRALCKRATLPTVLAPSSGYQLLVEQGACEAADKRSTILRWLGGKRKTKAVIFRCNWGYLCRQRNAQ